MITWVVTVKLPLHPLWTWFGQLIPGSIWSQLIVLFNSMPHLVWDWFFRSCWIIGSHGHIKNVEKYSRISNHYWVCRKCVLITHQYANAKKLWENIYWHNLTLGMSRDVLSHDFFEWNWYLLELTTLERFSNGYKWYCPMFMSCHMFV